VRYAQSTAHTLEREKLVASCLDHLLALNEGAELWWREPIGNGVHLFGRPNYDTLVEIAGDPDIYAGQFGFSVPGDDGLWVVPFNCCSPRRHLITIHHWLFLARLDGAQATFRNGVLSLHRPNAEETIARYPRLRRLVKSRVREGSRSGFIWKLAKQCAEQGLSRAEGLAVIMASQAYQSKHGSNRREAERIGDKLW
jgi:hypothetical protein